MASEKGPGQMTPERQRRIATNKLRALGLQVYSAQGGLLGRIQIPPDRFDDGIEGLAFPREHRFVVRGPGTLQFMAPSPLQHLGTIPFLSCEDHHAFVSKLQGLWTRIVTNRNKILKKARRYVKSTRIMPSTLAVVVEVKDDVGHGVFRLVARQGASLQLVALDGKGFKVAEGDDFDAFVPLPDEEILFSEDQLPALMSRARDHLDSVRDRSHEQGVVVLEELLPEKSASSVAQDVDHGLRAQESGAPNNALVGAAAHRTSSGMHHPESDAPAVASGYARRSKAPNAEEGTGADSAGNGSASRGPDFGAGAGADGVAMRNALDHERSASGGRASGDRVVVADGAGAEMVELGPAKGARHGGNAAAAPSHGGSPVGPSAGDDAASIDLGLAPRTEPVAVSTGVEGTEVCARAPSSHEGSSSGMVDPEQGGTSSLEIEFVGTEDLASSRTEPAGAGVFPAPPEAIQLDFQKTGCSQDLSELPLSEPKKRLPRFSVKVEAVLQWKGGRQIVEIQNVNRGGVFVGIPLEDAPAEGEIVELSGFGCDAMPCTVRHLRTQEEAPLFDTTEGLGLAFLGAADQPEYTPRQEGPGVLVVMKESPVQKMVLDATNHPRRRVIWAENPVAAVSACYSARIDLAVTDASMLADDWAAFHSALGFQGTSCRFFVVSDVEIESKTVQSVSPWVLRPEWVARQLT